MAFVRNHSGLRALKSLITRPVWRDNIKVVWLYGPTGRGKSHLLATLARAPGVDAYWKPSGPWFEGYTGEPYIFMDDFRAGDMQFSDLLKLCDKFPLRIPIKGSSAWVEADKIFITTPQQPEITYNEHEDIGQLMRRIDYIINVEELNVYEFKKGQVENFIQDFPETAELLAPQDEVQDMDEGSQAVPIELI
ncbi:MAG: RNA helicase domain-containing protein [Candidatus Methanomethylicaceae archaeon]